MPVGAGKEILDIWNRNGKYNRCIVCCPLKTISLWLQYSRMEQTLLDGSIDAGYGKGHYPDRGHRDGPLYRHHH